MDSLFDQLVRDEGIRLKMYQDSKGILTIGIGHNLRDKAISRRAAQVIFEDDVQDANNDLATHLPWTLQLDMVRREVLVNMVFNMGVDGVLKFVNTLALVKNGNYTEASQAMLQSAWAHQVGNRANRLSEQMRTGIRQ